MSDHPKLRCANNGDAKAIRTLVFDILKEYGLDPDPAETDSDLSDIEEHYQKVFQEEVFIEGISRSVGISTPLEYKDNRKRIFKI